MEAVEALFEFVLRGSVHVGPEALTVGVLKLVDAISLLIEFLVGYVECLLRFVLLNFGCGKQQLEFFDLFQVGFINCLLGLNPDFGICVFQFGRLDLGLGTSALRRNLHEVLRLAVLDAKRS